jgi:hypothetical protein
MTKLTLVFTVVIAGLFGCAGESANSSPPSAPSDDVDFKYNAPEESDAPAKKEDSAQADTKKEASKPPEAKKHVFEDSSVPATSCKGLNISKCKVTLGCAWSTDKTCVGQ